MDNATINREIAEKVMGINLKPAHDRAIVAVAWEWTHMTGPIFHLGPNHETRYRLRIPCGEALPAPSYDGATWNARYLLYAGQQIIAKGDQDFLGAVEAHRDNPKDFANDPAAVFGPGGLVEKVRETHDVTIEITRAGVRVQVYGATDGIGESPSITRAVCLVALAAVGGGGN